MTTSAHAPYGDEEEYIQVAKSILIEGRPVVTEIQPQTDGQNQIVTTTSKFALGQSLLILPFAAIDLITRQIVSQEPPFLSRLIVNSLPAAESAAICALLFLLIRFLGSGRAELPLSRRAALVVAGFTGVGTQIWPASRTIFADQSVALLLTFAVYSLVRFRYADDGAGWGVAASWAAAMMALCKNLLVLACPALLAYGIWAAMQRKREDRWVSNIKLTYVLAMTVLPFFLAIAVQLWHNHFRYGSIWLSGYDQSRDGDFGFSTPLLVGLYGILMSSGRSLFLYSPLCVLGVMGLRSFLARAPAEAALIAGVSLPPLLAYAKWWSWNGGWEWGNRFFLFLIPLLMWSSVPMWRWMDQELLRPIARRARQIALVLLIAVALYVQGLGVLIHPAAYWALTANELTILEHPVYEKGVWEIRDDMPLAHFVPEFSPLAAHHWLIWATWNRSRLDDRALANGAPWYSLNPKWAPRHVRPYLGFDLWFYAYSSREAGLAGYVSLVAGLLIMMVALCVLKLGPSITRMPPL